MPAIIAAQGTLFKGYGRREFDIKEKIDAVIQALSEINEIGNISVE